MAPMPRFAVIARLTVRRDALAEFRALEATAAEIMRRHAGRIEQTVVIDGDTASATLVEVHVVTFPDESAWDAYRSDPALRVLQSTRERVIESTVIDTGVEGPDYHA